MLHDHARDGDQRLVPIYEADGKRIRLPNEAFYRAHPSALAWHREHRFGVFLRE